MVIIKEKLYGIILQKKKLCKKQAQEWGILYLEAINSKNLFHVHMNLLLIFGKLIMKKIFQLN